MLLRLAVAAAVLMCVSAVHARLLYKIDFEAAPPADYELSGAEVTDAGGAALGGGKSLLADFSQASDEWHEFLTTKETVVFEAGASYHVSFRYRVIDSGGGKTRFYSLLRSASGGDIYGEFWLWNTKTGAEGTIHRLLEIKGKSDWRLILGVRHQGSILIDDIEIEKCEGDPPGHDLPVKPGKTDLLARKAALDKLRASEGMAGTLADMLIVWCNEGAGNKIADKRAQYARELNPDFVDWNSCGPLAQDFGVRTSGGGPEYQEFYKMEGPDVWNARYERFLGNGFAESLDATLIQDETWGEGGYFTCQNADGWHNWFIDELLRCNAGYLAMCQDNIGCAPFYKGHGCFCEPCSRKFRQWLSSRYSHAELAEFGIGNVGSFRIRDRVLAYGLRGTRALDDPVVREYIKFQFCSQLGDWADVVEKVKADGLKRGFPVPCYGNQFGGQGSQPFAVALGQFCDVVQIEEVIGPKNRIPNCSLNYKMGRAGGYESRPVWVRGPVFDGTRERSPQLSPLFWQTHFAEALANGGVRDISFGVNAPWTGDPNTLDYIDSPDVQRVWKDYSALCDANRAVFAHRKSLAQVALIYSLPSMMFRRFPPLGIDEGEAFARFDATAKWLDTLHVPYDCLIFGHPELLETATEHMARYKVIVLPCADALSDIQIGLLKQFAARGGRVVATGEVGTKDENLNRRSPRNRLTGLQIVDLAKDRGKAAEIIGEACILKIDAPEAVAVNAWLSADGSSVDVHLVNYAADLAGGTWSRSKPVSLTVNLPAGFDFDTVQLLRFGREPATLECAREGDRASVTVPAFGAYAAVSFANKAKLHEANAQARLRRQQDRDRVTQLAREKGLY